MRRSEQDILLTKNQALGVFAGRVLVSFAFMAFALGQIMRFEDACSIVQTLGMPFPRLYCFLSIALSFLGSISLGIGFRARTGVTMLFVCTACPAWLFFSEQANKLYLAGTMAVMGGLVPYWIFGPGPFTIDSARDERPHI